MQEDIYNRKNHYGAEVKRLNRAAISKKNKDTIEAFHKRLFSEGASNGRVIKLSAQLRKEYRTCLAVFEAEFILAFFSQFLKCFKQKGAQFCPRSE